MDKLPETFDELVQFIYESIDPVEFAQTKRLTEVMDLDEMASNAHTTVGRFIRNEFNLWSPPGAKLRQSIWDSLSEKNKENYTGYWAYYGHDFTGANMHAEDASHTVLLAVLKKIKDS